MTELGGDEANGKVGGGAEQTRHRLIEVPDYPLPQLSLIAQGLEPDGADMFIGGTAAARDIDLLRHHGISTVVNCAVNLDVNYVAAPVEGEADPDSKSQSRAGTGPFRVFKLGLVDGGGNPHGMMLAAYYMLHGALHQTLPEKQSYPRRERGNVLVHCRGGRSRSVALVALYLHLQDPIQYPELEDAIALVREKRELHPDEWFKAPKQELIAAMAQAARGIRSLRENGIFAI